MPDKRASRTIAFQLTGNPTERGVVTRMFNAEAQFPIAVWDFSWKIGDQVERFPELKYKIDGDQGGPAGLWNDLYHTTHLRRSTMSFSEEFMIVMFDVTGSPKPEMLKLTHQATADGLVESVPLDQAAFEDLYRRDVQVRQDFIGK